MQTFNKIDPFGSIPRPSLSAWQPNGLGQSIRQGDNSFTNLKAPRIVPSRVFLGTVIAIPWAITGPFNSDVSFQMGYRGRLEQEKKKSKSIGLP